MKHDRYGRMLTAALILTAACCTALPAQSASAAKLSAAETQPDSDYTYETRTDGTVRLILYSGTDSIITVPATLGGMPVTEICAGAFSECQAEKITVPDSVTEIQSYAFAYADELRELYLPEGLTELKADLCTECTALETVVIPDSAERIGNGIFFGCTALRTVNLPAALTRIPDNMFKGCSSLTEITLPETLESIGSNAFRGCRSLTELHLPEHLQTMESGAFAQCSALTEITIPPQIRHLSDHVFAQCDALTSAVIPETVLSIDDYAFQNDKKLTICGTAGSAAETHAEKYHFAFRLISETPPKSGCDLNGDGSVNVPDAVLLARYITESDATECDEETIRKADTDSDGILTVRDLMRLLNSL